MNFKKRQLQDHLVADKADKNAQIIEGRRNRERSDSLDDDNLLANVSLTERKRKGTIIDVKFEAKEI